MLPIIQSLLFSKPPFLITSWQFGSLVGIGVGDGVGVGMKLCCTMVKYFHDLGVLLGSVAVGVGDMVAVSVGVSVIVGVSEAVGETVVVGVIVAVIVGVMVAVAVKVGVSVSVGTAVGVLGIFSLSSPAAIKGSTSMSSPTIKNNLPMG